MKQAQAQERATSRPLSVVDGRDPAVLQLLLDFHARPGDRVLDVTCNRRRMWQGVTWSGPVTYADHDPTVDPDVVANFLDLPFPARSFDVLVFDPPHLPAAAASEHSHVQMVSDYGLHPGLVGDNVAGLFRPFLVEAARVLEDDGIVLCKLKDYVHNHRYQWMLVDFVSAVRSVEGLTACDLVVKRDPCGGNLKSGRWRRAHHVRNAHCWWIVVRKGACERARRRA